MCWFSYLRVSFVCFQFSGFVCVQEFSDAFLVVYGHTHKHIVDTTIKPYIVNPGASGKVRTQGGASCLLLESNNQNFSIQLKKFMNS